jgi:Ca2+-binding RTX toxin-like protein
VLVAGGDNSSLLGEAGIDTADFSGWHLGVTVDLSAGTAVSHTIPILQTHDSLNSIENVIGSSHDDTLLGDGGANQLVGGGGADVLTGGGGDDLLIGGGGADLIDGGAGSNTASYENSPGPVQANLAVHGGLANDANGDQLTNIQGLIGSSFGDNLTGDSGANLLVGGGGADVLTGSGGNDLFAFRPGDANGDTIVDFDAGDLLMFSGFGAGATLSQSDVHHLQVSYNNGTQHEVISFTNAVLIHPSDFLFN